MAKRVESGEKSHPLTTPACSLRHATSCPLTGSGPRLHTRTVSSEELVARCDPSWEKQLVHTLLVCPMRVVQEVVVLEHAIRVHNYKSNWPNCKLISDPVPLSRTAESAFSLRLLTVYCVYFDNDPYRKY